MPYASDASPARLNCQPPETQRGEVLTGYLVGSALMLGAAMIAAIWGVDAERKPLEHVAAPLSAVPDEP